jgi:hypothetical protein
MGPPTRQGPPGSASTRVLAVEGAEKGLLVTPPRKAHLDQAPRLAAGRLQDLEVERQQPLVLPGDIPKLASGGRWFDDPDTDAHDDTSSLLIR